MSQLMQTVLGNHKSSSRRESQRQFRRKAILAVARATFFEAGFAAASMSHIAAKLGGSKSTLWAYFPSKEALFAAAVEDAVAVLHEELKHVLQSGQGSAASLHAFADRFVETITSSAAISLHRLVVSEASRFPQLGRIFYESAILPVHDQLVLFFRDEMSEGRMRRAEPIQAAIELVSVLQRPQQFQLWNMASIMPARERRKYVAHAVDSFVRSYRLQAE